ncbi:MAG: ArnT family glycosyltransferase [Planctomycetia bacterium]
MAEEGTEPAAPPSARRRFYEAAAVGFIVLAAGLWSIQTMALGWDEGYTFDRLELLEKWFQRTAASPFDPANFTPAVLEKQWRFSRAEPDGHGPFYALLSLSGHWLTQHFLSPPTSLRFGTAAFFAFAAASVYFAVRRDWSAAASVAAVLCIAFNPRLSAEESYALIDGPLVGAALLSFAFFTAADRERSYLSIVLFGASIGLAMATKLTGWFLPLPYIAWSIWRAWRGNARPLLVVGPLSAGCALAVCLFLNVGWWPDPVGGVAGFFRSNLTRTDTIPIPSLFLGTVHPFSLPWYNTAVWTVVAIPVSVVLFGLLGAGSAMAAGARNPHAVLLLLLWLLIMVLRSLPQAPGHDGARQLAVGFAFFGALAGFGVEMLRRWASRRANARLGTICAWAAAAAAGGESIASCVAYHPVRLSYYSPVVGGLNGAAALGMEPTYFWDSLTPDALAWLNHNTPPDDWILFRNNPTSFEYLERWGRLTAKHKPTSSTPPLWLVVQHRPGLFLEGDRRLVAEGKPAFRKMVHGVPLLSVYPFSEVVRLNALPNRDPNGRKPLWKI